MGLNSKSVGVATLLLLMGLLVIMEAKGDIKASHDQAHHKIVGSLRVEDFDATGVDTCAVIRNGDKFKFQNCHATIKVETIAGVSLMSCEKFQETIFYGPLHVSTSWCQCSLVGQSLCSHKHDSELVASTDCKNDHMSLVKFLVFSLCTVSALIGMVLRYLTVRIGKRQGHLVLLGSTGGVFRYTATYKDTEEEGPFSLEDPTVPKAYGKKTVKMTMGRVLLCMLFFSSPKSYVDAKLVVDEWRFFSQSISEGDSIYCKGGSYDVSETMVSLIPVYNYETAPYQSKVEGDWFCERSLHGCGDAEQCMGTSGPSDSPSDEVEVRKNGKGIIKERSCVFFPNTCSFGAGCRIWNLIIEFQFNQAYRVFSLSSPTPMTRLIKKGDPECEVVDHRSELVVEYSTWRLVLSPGGKMHLCQDGARIGYPEFGMVGDLQFLENKKYNFKWRETTCTSDWIHGVSCSTPESFINHLSERCDTLPIKKGGLEISYTVGMLEVKRSGTTKVIMRSREKPTLSIVNSTCGGLKRSIWGVEGSGFPMVLVLETIEQVVGGSISAMLPCSGVTVSIKCDKQPVSFPMPDSILCNELPEGTEVHIVQSDTLGLLKEDKVFSIDPESTSFLSQLKNFLPSWPSILSMGGSAGWLVICVVVLLLRK